MSPVARSRSLKVLVVLAAAILATSWLIAATRTEKSGESRPSKTPRAFSVDSFAPTGMASEQDAVVVSFTANVVAASELNTTTSVAAPVLFDPSVTGAFVWDTQRSVRFVPRTALRKATKYIARINPQLRDLEGRRLEGKNEFTFSTPALRFREARQTGFTPDQRAVVQLSFTDAIVPTDLYKHLYLNSGGQPVRWRLESDVKTPTPRVVTDPLLTDTLTMRIEPGMRGASGPLPMTQMVPDRAIPLTFRLQAIELRAEWRKDRAALVIRFSNPVRTENLRDFLKVEPSVPFEIADEYDRLLLHGDFRPDTRYSVHMRRGLQGSLGQILMRDLTLSAWVPPMRPFIEIMDAGGHLSTRGTMKLRVRSCGMTSFQLTAERVFDNNLVYYVQSGEDEWDVTRLGREAASRKVEVRGEPGKAVLTEVDLRESLGQDAAGVYRLSVEGQLPATGNTSGESEDEGYGYYGSRLTDRALVAVSNLGIVSKRSGRQLTVWVAALDTARPITGAHVRAFSEKNQLIKEADTDANGLVTFPDMPDDEVSKPAVIVANSGSDITYLNMSQSLSGAEIMQSSGRRFLDKGYEAFVSGERGAYRPGERVHIFGMVRGCDASVPKAGFPVELLIVRPDGKSWEPRTVMLSETGSFTVDVQVPAYAPTGLYLAKIQLPGASGAARKRPRSEEEEESSGPADTDSLGQTEFFVEEFLPNRLKLDLAAPDRRLSTTETLTVTCKAFEMFGQPAGGRTLDGAVVFKPQPFAPKGFEGFAFTDPDAKFDKIETTLDENTVQDNGTAEFEIGLPQAHPPVPLAADIQITVKDVGGRGVTANIERVFDSADYYIGIRSRLQTYATVGKDASFEIVAVRPDNTLADTASLTATVSRVSYNSVLRREDGTVRFATSRELAAVQDFAIELRNGKGDLTWTPKAPGSYMLRVSNPVSKAVTAVAFYASSGIWQEQAWSLEKPEELEIVLDRQEYRVGDSARVIVKAPFAGTLLLTFEQDRVLTTTVIQMASNTHELTVPVEAVHHPNTYVVAEVLRPVTPAEKWLPHRAYGMTNLKVSSQHRQASVALQVPQETRPSADFETTVSVAEMATSAPLPCEVTLWAVDEGILTLTGFEIPDPLDFFYGNRALGVETADFFSSLMPDLVTPAAKKPATGGDGGPGEARRRSPVPSDRVKPVSLWLGTMKTGPDGKASGKFKVPQFMGRLRVMALAAVDQRFGNAEAEVFVRNPVMVKENLPRFLAPGDTAKVPFVVYNNTDKPGTVKIVFQTSGPVALTGPSDGAAVTVEVPARGMSTVPVNMVAHQQAGVASVKFAATMGAESFSDTVMLPVRPASAYVTTASYESVAAGETKEIVTGGDEYMDGTLSGTLVVSGLPTLQLAGGLRYVIRYPYGCLEQTASGAFPLLYLSDLAEQLEPGRYSKDAIRAMVQSGIDRLLMMQTMSGGLSMWPGEREPWPWGSVYAAHVLVEASKAGYEVPKPYLQQLLDYLSHRLAGRPQNPVSDTLTERCYTCYVLSLAGRKIPSRLEALYEARTDLTPTARALLASAFMVSGSAAEARELLATVQMPQSANQVAPDTGGILSSADRETAILLSALLDTNPNSAEVAALANRLMGSRRNGRWLTTQENAFALWALGRYAKKQSSGSGTFEGSIALGDGTARDFSTSAPLSVPITKPMKPSKVTVRSGGPVYVQVSADGVPKAPARDAISRGIAVTRKFVDRAGQLLNPQQFEQGKLAIVQIEIAADRNLDNVVIEDLLPAGLEIENANLASAEKIDGDEGEEAKKGLAVRRTEALDDRMVAFVDLPKTESNRHVFRYAVRAITEGTFVLPPVQVSCMYDPNIVATTAPDSVKVGRR